jgi:hypothetical protein
MSLRGAAGDEAISFSSKDCFAPLAMTRSSEFADTLLGDFLKRMSLGTQSSVLSEAGETPALPVLLFITFAF